MQFILNDENFFFKLLFSSRIEWVIKKVAAIVAMLMASVLALQMPVAKHTSEALQCSVVQFGVDWKFK